MTQELSDLFYFFFFWVGGGGGGLLRSMLWQRHALSYLKKSWVNFHEVWYVEGYYTREELLKS